MLLRARKSPLLFLLAVLLSLSTRGFIFFLGLDSREIVYFDGILAFCLIRFHCSRSADCEYQKIICSIASIF